tara:strand:- start:2 stop:634 length:633 start_codon:yes stop_codon:yes gene_type:complete
MKNIYQKLLTIQQRVNGLGKDKKSNTYSYVTGDKLLKEVKPMMNELGLLLKQEVLSIDNERMDYKTGVGTNYEKPKSEILSKVMMRFTWIDTESGEKDENLFGANGQNDWEKGLGSALTYAERYFLLKFFHIATDEDDIDNDSRKVIDEKPNETIKIDTARLETRLKACETPEAVNALYQTFTENEKAEMKETAIKIGKELKEKLTLKTA